MLRCCCLVLHDKLAGIYRTFRNPLIGFAQSRQRGYEKPCTIVRIEIHFPTILWAICIGTVLTVTSGDDGISFHGKYDEFSVEGDYERMSHVPCYPLIEESPSISGFDTNCTLPTTVHIH